MAYIAKSVLRHFTHLICLRKHKSGFEFYIISRSLDEPVNQDRSFWKTSTRLSYTTNTVYQSNICCSAILYVSFEIPGNYFYLFE